MKQPQSAHNGPVLSIVCDNVAAHAGKPLQIARLLRLSEAMFGDDPAHVWIIDILSRSQLRADQDSASMVLALPSPQRRLSHESEKRLQLVCSRCDANYSLTWKKARAVLDRIAAAGINVVSLSTLAATVSRKSM